MIIKSQPSSPFVNTIAPIRTHRFQVMIEKWSKKQDKNKTFVEYTLQVREYFSVNEYLEWKIKRRYSEFEKLKKDVNVFFFFFF